MSGRTQAQSAKYTYSPFGEVLLKEGVFNSRYQLSTKENDSATGLIYYGYRLCSPTMGVWLSRDPVNEIGHNNRLGGKNGNNTSCINTYVYVSNSPTQYYDIRGENPVAAAALCCVAAWVGWEIGQAIDALIEAIVDGLEDATEIQNAQEEFMNDPSQENYDNMLEAIDNAVEDAQAAGAAGSQIPGTGMQGPVSDPADNGIDAALDLLNNAAQKCNK